MAKPERWLLEQDRYPFSTQLQTRFQDLDTMGHINNVAMGGLFETARVRFHRVLGSHPREKGVRWLVAAVSMNFVAEAHFPHDITIASGIGEIGNSSWHVLSAAFQDGVCVATCDTVMVSHGPEGRRHIDDAMRTLMRNQAVRRD